MKKPCNNLILLSLVFIVGCHDPYVTKTEYVYYDNGNIKGSIQYLRDVKHGKVVKYYEDGSLFGEGFYKNGALDGKAVGYDEQGIKRVEMYHKNGVPVGTWLLYEDSLYKELNFIDGNPSDVTITNEDGLIWLNDQWIELQSKTKKGID